MKPKSLIDLYRKYDTINESEVNYSKQERQAFLERLKELPQMGQHVYRNADLGRVVQELGEIVELASQMNIKETEDGWFDSMTVKRHTKEMQNAYKVFEKTCNEVRGMQQRMEAAYEDIVERLKKYYEI